MSLFAPRPEMERASVLLPNVTCSSCSASIPLSSLGEHVCSAAPSRGLANRNAPRPSQISIPQARPAMARQPSSQGRGPSPTNIPPPFAGPSSAHPSPTEFSIPRRPSPTNLSPHDGPSGSYPAYPIPVKTPSPTNPFFPHPDQAQSSSSAHGLGMGAVEPQSSPMIDTTSGGESGMAGVGRRAFAAAAWGVRAGVALAKQHMEVPTPSPSYQTSNPAWPQPQPASQSSSREPLILPRVPLSGRQLTAPSPTFGARPEMHHSHTAPLAPTTSSYSPPRSDPASPPRRSASAMSHRSNPVSPPRRKESLSSNTSRSSSGQGESLSQLLRARTNTAPVKSNKPGFFDKVKEMHERSNTVSPVLGIGMARSTSGGSGRGQIHSSPQPTTLELEDDDYDDQPSALPWATPALEESPMMNRDTSSGTKHHRYPTAGSEASSSSSSSRSGRWGATSGESEEVVTPSQSLEMLSDRVTASSSKNNNEAGMRSFNTTNGGMEGRDILDQIGEEDEEEDEGERVVFGTPTARNIKDRDHPQQRYLPNSHSTSTITSTRPYLPTTVPHSSPNRKGLPTSSNENTPVKTHSHKSSTSSSNSISSTTISGTQRRKKVCVKCGDSVGGSKRFVERDGIVLCEKDWKKMYLPSCRRCNLPIEKSAVSSSDGQLKGKWHRECFTCYKCDKPFEGDDFYVYGGKPFCQFHYHEENGTLCAHTACHQPIEGSCIVTPGPNPQRFHPGHLKCDHRGGVSGAQNCREPMDEYYEIEGSRFCERHVGEALKGNRSMRAEKRRTRLVDLPFGVGGF
ncbi:hypothetical protein I302_104931 [Kwoniella bestiolae CBS 10118]|uniref:LIM zinc-binding domain-containing protein n=1 Tax=Kwoniella bestiolae CBS 10118 TaxID=1296100 RepID=A0A1B9FRD1_9TREE|nr:hypothetical protein I302_08998 [Kwoniella bestiolae CBS 10118]OCF21324.1 hypothetical protein I302_08998 [Kwoniella bestiolae CBS 10118]